MKMHEITEGLVSTLAKGAQHAITHIKPESIQRMRQLTNNLDHVIDRARISSPQDMTRAVSQLHAELNAVAHQFPELATKLQPAILHIRSAMGQPATATTVLQQVKQILN